MFRFARLRRLAGSVAASRSHRSRAGVAEKSTVYGRMMASHPLLTSAFTGSLLWSVGDLAAQVVEMKAIGRGRGVGGVRTDDSEEGHPRAAAAAAVVEPVGLDVRRLGGTLVHGAVVGGAGTYMWYTLLDRVVRHTLRLRPGGLAFVLAKLALEILVWHPTSLLCYWTIVGTAQGHSADTIREELRASFVTTLAGDAALWAPIDLLCFWKVPVSMQTLFNNAGSFVESIALSYVHEHSLDLFAGLSWWWSPSAPATATAASSAVVADNADGDDDDAEEDEDEDGDGDESDDADDGALREASVCGSKHAAVKSKVAQLLSLDRRR